MRLGARTGSGGHTPRLGVSSARLRPKLVSRPDGAPRPMGPDKWGRVTLRWSAPGETGRYSLRCWVLHGTWCDQLQLHAATATASTPGEFRLRMRVRTQSSRDPARRSDSHSEMRRAPRIKQCLPTRLRSPSLARLFRGRCPSFPSERTSHFQPPLRCSPRIHHQ